MVNSLRLSICYVIWVARFEAMSNYSQFTCEENWPLINIINTILILQIPNFYMKV